MIVTAAVMVIGDVDYSLSGFTFARSLNIHIAPNVILFVRLSARLIIYLLHFSLCLSLDSMSMTRVLMLLVIRLKTFVHVPVSIISRSPVNMVLLLSVRRRIPILVLTAISFIMASRVSAFVKLTSSATLRLRIALIIVRIIMLILVVFVMIISLTVRRISAALVSTSADSWITRTRYIHRLLHRRNSISIVVLTLRLVSIVKACVFSEPSSNLVKMSIFLVASSSIHTFIFLMITSTHTALDLVLI
jgi:hypothetical protein